VLVQTSAALQLTTQLAATNDQLHKLGIALLLVALGGVVLAVILGWIVGRTALIPLNDLTDAVEQVAETTDVSRRLDPGGDDELGRLRRTFNHLLAALEAPRTPSDNWCSTPRTSCAPPSPACGRTWKSSAGSTNSRRQTARCSSPTSSPRWAS